MKVISFLASHRGSAVKEIINAVESGLLKAEIGVVITNNRASSIFDWCVQNNVAVHHVSGKTYPDEKEKDGAIRRLLLESLSDYVVLSGYMKKVGPATLEAFHNRIINIHPSLLPRHGGKGLYGDAVHESVLASGDRMTGATVHLINKEYDEGPILIQKSVPVRENDTVESLKQRVQAIEGELYIEAIRKLT